MKVETLYNVGQKLNYKIDGGRAVCMVQAIRVRISEHEPVVIYEVLAKWKGEGPKKEMMIWERAEQPTEAELQSYNNKGVK